MVGRIVSVAVIIAVGVNADGRREVLGIEVGTSEAEPIWTEFLRKLTRRGLRGVKLVISDAHEGLKAAVTKVLSATWQRCRVHFMRNVLAHAGKSGRRVVSAFIATAFAQETPEAASVQWRAVADQIRPNVPKLAAILDDAEPDVLAYMTFPKEHRAKLHSTNPIERLNGEIKRRTDAKACAIGDRQRRQMFETDRCAEQATHFVRAQDVRQATGITQPHQLTGEIRSVNRMNEEEAQRRNDGVHRRHAEAGFLLGHLEAMQIIDGRRVGRPPQKRCQATDVAHIVALRLGREPAHGHVLDQALARRADRSGGNR